MALVYRGSSRPAQAVCNETLPKVPAETVRLLGMAIHSGLWGSCFSVVTAISEASSQAGEVRTQGIRPSTAQCRAL